VADAGLGVNLEEVRAHFGWMWLQGADVKYIDPTYMIRAVPTNPNDRIYCKVRRRATPHSPSFIIET
jgi:6-phosphofructokinase 1